MGGKRKAFTLVEMLVVITIIGILMALILPAISAARARAQRTTCADNMRNVAQALTIEASRKGYFPYYVSAVGTKNINWTAAALKHIRGDVYDQWVSPSGSAIADLEIGLFLCPSDLQTSGTNGKISYVYNAGRPDSTGTPADHRENGVGHSANATPRVQVPLDFISRHDGIQLTILLSENLNAGNWTETAATASHSVLLWMPAGQKNINQGVNEASLDGGGGDAYMRPSSAHPQVVNVAFCDGSVRDIAETIDYTVYARLMTPYGAEAKEPGANTSTASLHGWVDDPLNEGDF